jgi:hypothetical protein
MDKRFIELRFPSQLPGYTAVPALVQIFFHSTPRLSPSAKMLFHASRYPLPENAQDERLLQLLVPRFLPVGELRIEPAYGIVV